MTKLNEFIRILTGSFDNLEQFRALQSQGVTDFPYAEHVNTVCNDKITGLPEGFPGVFMVEESYYTRDGKTHAAPHLFLFTEEPEGVRLTSYEIPEGYHKTDFTYRQLKPVPYSRLHASEKFTPALYTQRDGVWEGGSVSMFSPVIRFNLAERFSEQALAVSESMEVNGKRTFGYDVPIVYKRKPCVH